MARIINGRTYGHRYTMTFGSLDGYRYRVLFYVYGYADAVSPVELDGASEPVVVEWGRRGGLSTLWDPFFASEMRVRFLHEGPLPLAEVITGNDVDPADPVGLDDYSVLAVLQRETNAILDVWSDEWAGFVLPDTVQDWAFEKGAVELSAYDGFGVWRSQAYTMTGERTLIETIADCLSTINAFDEPNGHALWTIMQWHPYRASSELGAAAVPLSAIYTPESAWRKADLYTLRYEVMRQVLGRFSMELFQSEGKWYALQPYQMDSGAFPLSTRGKIFDKGGTLQLQWNPANYEKSADDFDFRAGVPRLVSGGASAVASTYDFTPDLDSLLYNASFEEADTAGGYVDPSGLYYAPRYWSVTPGVSAGGTAAYCYRYPAVIGPTAEDSWLLLMEAADLGDAPCEILQENIHFVPANGDQIFSFRWNYGDTFLSLPSKPMTAYPTIGDHYLALTGVGIQESTAVLKGREVTVYVSAVLDGVPGAVVGTKIMPAGEVVTFTGGQTLTLSQDVAVGDTQLSGELSDNLSGSEQAGIYYWTTDQSSAGLDMSFTWPAAAYLRTPDGADVTGFFSMRLVGAVGPGPTYNSTADNLRTQIKIDGRPVRSYTWQAAVARRGQALEVGPWLIGDGPALESDSRLLVDDGASGTESTMQAGAVGWKTGYYGPGESTSGRQIDQHQARELLRTVCRGVEERSITLMLRNQQTFRAHHVLTYAHEETGETMRLWRQSLRWDVRAGEMAGRFRRLYYDTSLTVTEAMTSANESAGTRQFVQMTAGAGEESYVLLIDDSVTVIDEGDGAYRLIIPD